MKRFAGVFFGVVFAVSAFSAALAADLSPGGEVFKKAQAFIGGKVQGSTVIEVGDSPIPGVYEVLALFGQPPQQQPNVFYYYPDKDVVMAGNMIDSSGKPIGQPRIQAYLAKKMGDLNLKDAIKIGSGPVEVVEFTDPDCPYCRKLEQFLMTNHNNDVTRYIFLFPIKNLHPNAEAKSRYILCSANPEKEFLDTIAGKYDNDVPKVGADHCDERMKKHFDVSGKAGVQGTPLVMVDKKRVEGFNIDLIARYIEEGKKNAQTSAPKK